MCFVMNEWTKQRDLLIEETLAFVRGVAVNERSHEANLSGLSQDDWLDASTPTKPKERTSTSKLSIMLGTRRTTPAWQTGIVQ
jgi:hypothetical protein